MLDMILWDMVDDLLLYHQKKHIVIDDHHMNMIQMISISLNHHQIKIHANVRLNRMLDIKEIIFLHDQDEVQHNDQRYNHLNKTYFYVLLT